MLNLEMQCIDNRPSTLACIKLTENIELSCYIAKPVLSGHSKIDKQGC